MDKLQLLQVAKKMLLLGGGKENKEKVERKHSHHKTKTMRTRSLNIFDEYDNITRSPNPDSLGSLLPGNSTSASNLPGNRSSVSVLNRTQSISISSVFKDGSHAVEDEKKEQKRKYHSVKQRSKRPVLSIVDSLNLRPGSLGRKNIYAVQPKPEAKFHQKLIKSGSRPLQDFRRSKSPGGRGSTGSSPPSVPGDSLETSEDSEDEIPTFDRNPKVFTSKQSLVEYFKGLQNPISQSPVTKQQCRRPHIPSVDHHISSVNLTPSASSGQLDPDSDLDLECLDKNRNLLHHPHHHLHNDKHHHTHSLKSLDRYRDVSGGGVEWDISDSSQGRNKVIRAKSCLKKPTKHFTVRPASPVSLTRPRIISKTDLNTEPSPTNYIVKDHKSNSPRTPKATRKLSLKIRGDNVEIKDIVIPRQNKVKLHRQSSSSGASSSSIVRETIKMKDFDEISVVDNIANDPSDAQELRSIDKIDEMTKSIFSDVAGSCDNQENMLEINFY